MKLRAKTIVTMGTALAALFLVLYVLSNYLVQKGFLQLEERYAQQNVDRVQRTIAEQQFDLDASAADWAIWDDTYRFVQDRNPAYIQANLSSDTLKLLKVNVLLIVDCSGKVAWGGAYDLEKSEEMPLPADLVRLAAPGSPLISFGPERDRISGLALLDGGPINVAARPILTTKAEGPARGVVMIGRYLNASEVHRLGGVLQLKFSLFRADIPPAQPLPRATMAALLNGEPNKILALNRTTLAGYGLLRDLDGKPAVMIEAEMPRDIYAQGLKTSSFFTGALLLIGAFFGVAIVSMLKKQVIARLERLSRDIGLISKTQDFSQRVLLPGTDELSSLAADINGMLEQVVESRRSLEKSKERFRQIAVNTADWIWETDISGLYTYANPAVEQILGYKPEEIIGRKYFYELFKPEEKETLKKATFEAMARKERLRGFINANAHKNGHVVVLETNATPIADEKGTLLGYRGADQDITQRKQAEEEIRQLNVTLEQRIHDRTNELEKANKQLRIEIIERQRAEERIRKVNRVQASLFEPGALEEKMKKITDGVVDVFDADFARIWLTRPGDRCELGCIHARVKEGPHGCRNRDRCLHLISSSGRYTRVDGETHRRVPFGCYKIGLIASGQVPDFLTNDMANDPRIHNQEWAKALGLTSFAGYQMSPPRGETIGVMAVFSKHALSAEEDMLLKSFSNLVVQVTQTAQAEKALRESEQRFAAAFQKSPIAMSINTISDDKYVDVNDLYLEHVEYAREEVIGRTSLELGIYADPQDRERLLTLARKQGYVYGQECNFKIKSGKIISCLTYLNTVSIGGQPRLLSSILNITERKRMEADLLAAKRDAEVANRAKSEFLSRMSHELRTPLNAILGFAQLLEMDNLSEKSNARLKQILEGGRHLLKLINEVLDLARIEAGRLFLSTEPVLVSELAAETLNLIRPLADKRQIRLEERLSSRSEWVHADRQRLKQVLLNLLSNAIKYNREGGVVTIGYAFLPKPDAQKADEKKEEAAVSNAIGPSLRLFIRDTGPGIPPELRLRLFRSFERLDPEKSDIQGTGLGLALSKGLMEAMGGTIGVESISGQGSVFWVELPIAKREERRQTLLQTEASDHADSTPARHKTVLYVEDNFSNLKLVESIFTLCPGVELLTTMQDQMALEMARERQPSLILLDPRLPDLDGNEVLSQLQADPRTRAIPVAILNAEGSSQQNAGLLADGARRYFLAKPIDVKKLLDLLNDILYKGSSLGVIKEIPS